MATSKADNNNAATETNSGDNLQAIVYKEIQSAAAPVAIALNMPNVIPVASGNFPWHWQLGTNFNAATFDWLNSLFAYEDDGYVRTNGQALTTSLFNVLHATSYVLDSADAAKVNKAVLANATVVNTVITDWTTSRGPIPSTCTTQAQQIDYVTKQVLSWGNPGLTLGQLRTSINPAVLLPNRPIGGDQLVNDLMTYLANTSSIANIQAAVVAFNNELEQVRRNLVPQTPLTEVRPGFMATVDSNGEKAIQVEMKLAESTAKIQNNLFPAAGTGKSFSAKFKAIKQANDQVQLSAKAGVQGFGPLGFIELAARAGSKADIFSADGSQTTCEITLTYNGVTVVTPRFTRYNATDGAGWWFPGPIEEAANGDPRQSGYQFNPEPKYNFDVNGNFGAIGRLMISQQPVISLCYKTSNYAAYEKKFEANARWGVSIFGIPIAGGSLGSYQSHTSYDSQSSTVTVTMNPEETTTPVAPADQLAHVIGAEIVWPGASESSNRAGI